MTRQEKKENFKTYMEITHIGTWGFIICIILIGLTSMLKFAFIGCAILVGSLILGNIYYLGGKAMFNPLQLLKDVKEKQDALLEYLKLKAILIPRHWNIQPIKKERA